MKEMNLETFARVSNVTRENFPTDLKEASHGSENFLIIVEILVILNFLQNTFQEDGMIPEHSM